MHAERFKNDPLHYMALGKDVVYGISASDLSAAYELEEEGRKASTFQVRRVMKSVLKIMNEIYAPMEFTENQVFPFTTVEFERDPDTHLDKYHKSATKKLKKRVIPIYVFPFISRMKSFKKQPEIMDEIDRFCDVLKDFAKNNPRLSHHYDSWLQIKENRVAVLLESELTADTLKSNILKYQRDQLQLRETVEEFRETVEELRETVRALRGKVEALEKMESERRKKRRRRRRREEDEEEEEGGGAGGVKNETRRTGKIPKSTTNCRG